MNIIFLSRKHGKPRTLQLPPRYLALVAVMLVVLCTVVGAAGYYVAARLSGSTPGAAIAMLGVSQEKESCKP